jgi:hypothetical protein
VVCSSLLLKRYKFLFDGKEVVTMEGMKKKRRRKERCGSSSMEERSLLGSDLDNLDLEDNVKVARLSGSGDIEMGTTRRSGRE